MKSAGKRAEQRGLACTRWPDDGDLFAGCNINGCLAEGRRCPLARRWMAVKMVELEAKVKELSEQETKIKKLAELEAKVNELTEVLGRISGIAAAGKVG